MKKLISLILTLGLTAAFLTGCGGSGGSSADNSSAGGSSTSSGSTGGTLTLYTWEGMFPQEILDSFQEATGIGVNYQNFDFDETMLAKLETAGGGDYDLVIADDYIIETVIAEGLAQKLDFDKLPSYSNVNPIYKGQFFDPADEYTVPYGAGVQTIVYNPDTVSLDITGYADLWDSSLEDSLGMIANYRVINGMALKVLGESYNTDDTAKIQEAGELLKELAPNVRLIKDDYLESDLLSGEIDAAIMYTSQVTSALMENPDLKTVYPKEGIGFGVMAGFIPSKAPNAEAAYQFLEYILDPERAADCFEYLGYYCTNLAAEPYIDEQYRAFLTMPSEFSASDMELIGNISAEADEAHALAWTEFKSLCE